MPAPLIWAPLRKTLFAGPKGFLGENGPFHFSGPRQTVYVILLCGILLCIDLALYSHLPLYSHQLH